MKKIVGIIFWGCIIYFIYSYFSADTNASNQYQNSNSYSARERDCSSLEPTNPYNQGSGHYAGFQWGERGNSCGGNSSSFIEGCEEYQNQEEMYTRCEDGN